jgi:hypothetical protein
MFPRGGTHWDALGGALAAQALTGAADADGGRLTPFSFSVALGWRPTGDDRDLYDMLNLVAPDDRYPVPLLTYHSTPPTPCRPQRIAQVAGSFVFRLNESLMAVACPPEIHLYWYWDQRAFVYPNGSRIKVPMDAERRTEDLLRWADLVILEENEATIPARQCLAAADGRAGQRRPLRRSLAGWHSRCTPVQERPAPFCLPARRHKKGDCKWRFPADNSCRPARWPEHWRCRSSIGARMPRSRSRWAACST